MDLPRPVLALTFAIIAAAAESGWAQALHHDWRTLETPGYRVHYPAEYEAWAQRTARQLEAIRTRLADEVSFRPARRTDVVVMDPVAQPNGMALPLLGAPRMMLWTSPPGSDSVLGQFRSWPELLAVHEDAHLVHLLRPSRNPFWRALEHTIVPVGPITLRSPRWAVEGYATLLEGQLTGWGRPHSDLRAAILRRWAQRGRLPSYERLGSDRERWQGMSMAYLAGSAYLEWLVDRRGPTSLPDLWARLTARTVRSFDEAFRGVFGETPAELYGRFTAELTARAMAAERAIAPHLREGALWQHLEWSTGVPAVSPGGDRLAIVLHQRQRPARLVVWSTGPDEEAEREWRERIRRMLQRDPDDVAPVRDRPLPRKPLHELPAIDGAEPDSPRWTADGTSLLFVRLEPDAQGFLHPDLFRWHVGTSRIERITRLANVRQPDPAPSGDWAAAVRHRHGFSQLVHVNLGSGQVTPLTEPSVDVVHDAPRVSPDGTRLLYLRHTGEGWRPVVRELASGQERELRVPRAATVAHPAWSRDGRTVFLSIGRQGFIDIHALPLDSDSASIPVTRTHGAALGAEPASARELFFLSLEPHGLDLRLITVAPAPRFPDISGRESLVPAVRPAAPDPPLPATSPVGPGRPYGTGRQEFTPLLGGLYAPAGRLFEIGLRGGDVLGRLSYLAAGSFARGNGAAEGGALAAAWRGWPATVRAHAFSVHERPSRQPTPVPGLGAALDARRRGLEVDLDWQRRTGRRVAVAAAGGALAATVERLAGESFAQHVLFGEVGIRVTPSRGSWRWRYSGDLRLDAGRTAGSAWRRSALQSEIAAGYHLTEIRFTYDRRRLGGSPSLFDRVQVGGVPGSIVPPALAAPRAHAPALPAGTLIGDRYERQRLELRAILTLPLFYERHRVNAGAWLRIVGTEVDVATTPMPLVPLPAARLRIGAARVMDAPGGDDTRLWLALSWRP